jgi:hypothetical protein
MVIDSVTALVPQFLKRKKDVRSDSLYIVMPAVSLRSRISGATDLISLPFLAKWNCSKISINRNQGVLSTGLQQLSHDCCVKKRGPEKLGKFRNELL